MKPLNRLVWLFLFAAVAVGAGLGIGRLAPRTSELARAGISLGEPSSGQAATVTIKGMAFTPGRVEVAVGSTVVFTNADNVAHTVTARDGSWNSGNVAPGGSWRRTFSRSGTYSFFCQPHPQMTGTVVVK